MSFFINNNIWTTFTTYEDFSYLNNLHMVSLPRFSFMNDIFNFGFKNNISYKLPTTSVCSSSSDSVFNFRKQNNYDYFSPITKSSFAAFTDGLDLNYNKTVKKQEKTDDITIAKTADKTYDNTKTVVKTSTWDNFSKKYGVKKISINGSDVYACKWSKFSKSQSEWLDLQKYMIEAAEELGLTLVYSDMDRTVATSNACRAKKGSIVVKGGQSPHNYGVATDICLFKDGNLLSSKSAKFAEFAELVKEKSNNRIAWGGDWTKKDEEHHFELRGWRDKYKNEENLIC